MRGTRVVDSFALLQAFARDIQARLKPPAHGDPEDQLKRPVEDLLRSFAESRSCIARVSTESRVQGLGRPDAAVLVDERLVGHVELKPPGKGARVKRFTGHDKNQWERFKNLPNVLYTDGEEFGLYQRGTKVQFVALDADPVRKGASAVSRENAERLEALLQAFISWAPATIANPRQLAEQLAPLCHLLRSQVAEALSRENSRLELVAEEWRELLFPDASDEQFADAYAQTLTYALLLARIEGQKDLEKIQHVAVTLKAGHKLLGEALLKLGEPDVLEELAPAPALLERVLEAVDDKLAGQSRELWDHFYEDFLAEYDPRLRRDRGVYYTPLPVVRAQVRLIDALLRGQRFQRPLGFADDKVVVLDPAVGTGTYLLVAFEHGAETAKAKEGEGAVPARATRMGEHMHGFEILVGPYTVAHLRTTQILPHHGGRLPRNGVQIYLTDTLAYPYSQPPALWDKLAEEQVRALTVKKDEPVLVCLGNPPDDREQRDLAELQPGQRRKGGWIRYGGDGRGPLLEDFLAAARAAGAGVHLKNLYNDYVYFWRWALWKVFEQNRGPGIVSFITASSYLRGPGSVGMREFMRRQLDELWIVDLGGDNLGPRKTENVFDIQTPVAIAVAVRYGEPDLDTPAKVWYTKIAGNRDEKYARLDAIRDFACLPWRPCFSGWMDPFLPVGEADFLSWPLLTDLFPWQHSGVQFKRTWPIGESKELLERRWRQLLASPDRAAAFRPGWPASTAPGQGSYHTNGILR